MDVGTTLQTARERHGVTLAQLSSRTKIPVPILQALEENAFEKVPGGIFVRGFLRAYATEVGLDPAETVSQYRAETGIDDPAPADAPPPAQRSVDEIEQAQIDPDLTASGPGWGYVLIVAALLVALVSVNRSDTPDSETLASDAGLSAANQSPGSAGALQPVATAGQTLPALEGGSKLSALRFDMQAQALCWVEAVVDGRRLVYRLMQPGERQTIESAQEIVLRVGDPAALSYSINGAAGEPLGRAGIPVTVRFTKGGEKATLAS